MMPADPSRISVTAKLAAYYRQFSDIPFAEEVAAWIGADDALEQILSAHGLAREELNFYAPMFEARYKSINQLIRKFGASQVLELASGYTLRGFDLALSGSIRYAEVDLPGVITTKLQLLDELRRRHGIPASELHTVTAADALDPAQVRAAAAVFDREVPLMVMCEGLIGYLTRKETERLTTNVHTLLTERQGGWWIVPDFYFKADVRDLPPARVRLREAVAGVTQRQLDASAFEDAEDLKAFLHQSGFDAEVRSQIDETPSFSSVPALGLSPDLIDRLRPILRLWVLTPRS